MARNLIVVAFGVLISFALAFAGWRLAIIVGSSLFAAPMDAAVGVLWAYGLAPLVFVVVATAVASIVSRPRWWLGGVTLLPLLIYGLTRPAAITFIPLLVGYIVLAFAAAFLASRLKRAQSS